MTEQYEERLARIDRKSPEDLSRLAAWCERKGLAKRAERLLREVLAIDPDHAATRARLGYVRHDGRWMTPEEARATDLASKGLFRE